MSKVQRYQVGKSAEYESEEGEWVMYADYAALEAKYAALEADARRYRECLKTVQYRGFDTIADLIDAWDRQALKDAAP